MTAPTQDVIRRPVLILLVVGALVAWFFAGPYTMEILTRIAIFVIFALSIDFLVGYTGLITMGHAGFLGVGAYATAYFGALLGWPMGITMIATLAVGVIAGLLVGIFVVRVSGVFFIMVTLAISMMFYAWAAKALTFGRDDGMAGIPRLGLDAIGIDLSDASVYCLFVMAIAALTFVFFDRLVRSPFGQTLKAIHQNENRIRSLGCPVQRYKLAAFAIAGAAAALAGSLHAQQNNFINPQISHWTISGEGLIFVIIGGAGTLVGPIIGTVVYLVMETVVALFTKKHSLLWMGLFFITIVLIASDGLYGRLNELALRLRGRRTEPAERTIPRGAETDA